MLVQTHGIVSQVAGGVAPLPVTSGLTIWLSELVNSGVTRSTLSDATEITQWDDKSGLGHHAYIKESTYYPSYNAGDDSILFDGSDEALKSANYTGIVTLFTTFIVYKTSVNKFPFMMYRSAGSRYRYMYDNGCGIETVGSGGNSSKNIGSGWFKTGAFLLLTWQCDGTNAGHWVRKNASLQSTSTCAGTNNPSYTSDTLYYRLGQGGGASDAAYYKELINYDRALSSDEYQAVENYLNNKYSIY